MKKTILSLALITNCLLIVNAQKNIMFFDRLNKTLGRPSWG
ncbi:MAG: hypothetical protein WCH21_12950 [Bacteroidota bacterium]